MIIVIFAMNREFFLLLLIDALNIDSHQICVELLNVGKKYLFSIEGIAVMHVASNENYS